MLESKGAGEKKSIINYVIGYLVGNVIGRTNSYYTLGRWINDTVPEDELPLLLPETDEIKPSGTGESPLANIDAFVNVIDEKTGMKGAEKPIQCLNGLAVAGTIYVTLIHKRKNDSRS